MAKKTIFITGASTGIGAATARAAAAAGWNVALFARSADKLEALAGEIGEAALALPGDVTDLAAQEAAVAKTVETFGGLDAAFANAGKGIDTPGTVAGDPAVTSCMPVIAPQETYVPSVNVKPRSALSLTRNLSASITPWSSAVFAVPTSAPSTRTEMDTTSDNCDCQLCIDGPMTSPPLLPKSEMIEPGPIRLMSAIGLPAISAPM